MRVSFSIQKKLITKTNNKKKTFRFRRIKRESIKTQITYYFSHFHLVPLLGGFELFRFRTFGRISFGAHSLSGALQIGFISSYLEFLPMNEF
ncbi:hypothetical protein IMY05_006G0107500 [Salix suchowensis]|nr:hypothetical protein IMY05_006G0107500 [Salix suchowensis]